MPLSRMWCTSVVMMRAPEPPSGWPRAMAPPFGLSALPSAPMSASQARGTGAKASLTSNAPISSTDRPERCRALRVAGMGAVSMMIGSVPASTAVWIRATGTRPSSAAFSLVVISSAAEPSEICEELPAVITPPSGLKTVLSAPRAATVLPRRTPSSRATTVPSSSLTGAICPPNRPSSCAAAARDDHVVLPGDEPGGGEVHRLLAGPALPVHGDPGDRLRPARGQQRAPGDIQRLLADLRYAAPDHVVDDRRIDTAPPGQRLQHVRGQLHRMNPGQPSVPLADRRPDRLDDDRVPHGFSLRRGPGLSPAPVRYKS